MHRGLNQAASPHWHKYAAHYNYAAYLRQ